jgi:hypothetical protein
VLPGPPAFAREASKAATPKPIGEDGLLGSASYGSASHRDKINCLSILVFLREGPPHQLSEEALLTTFNKLGTQYVDGQGDKGRKIGKRRAQKGQTCEG